MKNGAVRKFYHLFYSKKLSIVEYHRIFVLDSRVIVLYLAQFDNDMAYFARSDALIW